jgi:NAD+ synthetase
MKIALCQINPVAGNITYNLRRIVEEMEHVARAGVDLAVFPELAIPGYPPKDLLEYPEFLGAAENALEEIKAACGRLKLNVIVGTIAANIFGGKKPLCNAAIYLAADGVPPVIIYKKLLPTYDVFDEQRYFDEAPADLVPPIITLPADNGDSVCFGVVICEDLWNDNEFWRNERLYPVDPVDALVDAGAQVIINISSSPYTQGKPLRRLDMMRHIARRRKMPVIMVNQVGGNDQVVFDGGSCVVLPEGTIPCIAGWFVEKTMIWDMEQRHAAEHLPEILQPVESNVRSIVEALKLGLHDYMARTGFTQVLVGNSGGIDSAVVLALAVHTLGADKVISVTMPSQFTSSGTFDDAGALAGNLGIRHLEIPILSVHEEFSNVLAGPESAVVQKLFQGDSSKMNRIAEENVQARIRANILMYISNSITAPRTLLLTTGNKSELAVGYCTLYGDMSGGLALISDVPKTTVYRLARELNVQMGEVIPQSIIDREPSAELAPGQKDQDSLPPYPVLDEIIRLFVEDHLGADDIVAAGVADDATVRRVVGLIEIAEYKRAQAAPGIKVTSKAFGAGRRVPIARGTPIF